MSKNIDLLKDQLKAMLDSTEDKAAIEQIGQLNSLLNNIEGEYTALQDENKEMLKDYKEVIKHVAFPADGKPHDDVSPETFTFESFAADYLKNKK